jgi:hypothetical protein
VIKVPVRQHTRDELGASDPLAHTDATAPAAPLGSANWTHANGVEHNTLEMFRVVLGWPLLLMTSARSIAEPAERAGPERKSRPGNASGQTHGALQNEAQAAWAASTASAVRFVASSATWIDVSAIRRAH